MGAILEDETIIQKGCFRPGGFLGQFFASVLPVEKGVQLKYDNDFDVLLPCHGYECPHQDPNYRSDYLPRGLTYLAMPQLGTYSCIQIFSPFGRLLVLLSVKTTSQTHCSCCSNTRCIR